MAAAAALGAEATNDPPDAAHNKRPRSPKKKLTLPGFMKLTKSDNESNSPEELSGSQSMMASAKSKLMGESVTSHLVRIEELLQHLIVEVSRCDHNCSTGLLELRRSCEEWSQLGGCAPQRDRSAMDQSRPSKESVTSGIGFLPGVQGRDHQQQARLSISRPGRKSVAFPMNDAFLARRSSMGEAFGNGLGNPRTSMFPLSAAVQGGPSRVSMLRSASGASGAFDPNRGEAISTANEMIAAELADLPETAPLISKEIYPCVCWQESCIGSELNIEGNSALNHATLKQDVRRGYYIETVTNFLDDPESSKAAEIFNRAMPIFILCTVLITLSQSIEPPLLEGRPAAEIETSVDIFFTLEICLRMAFAPNVKRALLSPYNFLDVLASMPLAIRAYHGFSPPMEDGCFTRNALLCGVPVLRTMKVLRRFRQFQLLLKAFAQVFEALPVLLYTLAVFVLTFSALIYIVEPRDNITCLPEAVWLAIVTMSTVGYGDITPVSTLGTVIVSILVILSALYMAMPLGIIGYTFTNIWKDRDRILLMLRTHERLQQWGYEAADILVLFSLFDGDGDGELDMEEFRELILKLRIGLRDDRIAELFAFIDKDGGGSIDDLEFVRAIFPTEFHEIYNQKQAQEQGSEEEWVGAVAQ